MGLPVLRLPSLVFDNIHQFLNVSEIILLSQCSRRVRDLVRSQEGPRTGRQVSVRFYKQCATVEIVRRTSDFCYDLLFTLKVHSSVRNRNSIDEKSFFTLNVDGTTWDVKKCPPSTIEKWYCVSEEGCYEKDVLIIVKMLRNLFNCSISDIKYYSPNVNFQKLFVETDALHRADNIFVDDHQIAPEEMDFMFDHFVTDYLCFRGNGGPDYSYQKPFNFPRVYLEHATWINLEKVFEMTKISKHVDLYEAKLIADEDINQIIKWWLTSDNKTLEFFAIARGQMLSFLQPPVVDGMDRSVIMEGIESTPGKKKRDEATKNLSYIQWENGVDIVRKVGVRATILLKNGMYCDEFLFAVWDHPNPNVDD